MCCLYVLVYVHLKCMVVVCIAWCTLLPMHSHTRKHHHPSPTTRPHPHKTPPTLRTTEAGGVRTSSTTGTTWRQSLSKGSSSIPMGMSVTYPNSPRSGTATPHRATMSADAEVLHVHVGGTFMPPLGKIEGRKIEGRRGDTMGENGGGGREGGVDGPPPLLGGDFDVGGGGGGGGGGQQRCRVAPPNLMDLLFAEDSTSEDGGNGVAGGVWGVRGTQQHALDATHTAADGVRSERGGTQGTPAQEPCAGLHADASVRATAGGGTPANTANTTSSPPLLDLHDDHPLVPPHTNTASAGGDKNTTTKNTTTEHDVPSQQATGPHIMDTPEHLTVPAWSEGGLGSKSSHLSWDDFQAAKNSSKHLCNDADGTHGDDGVNGVNGGAGNGGAGNDGHTRSARRIIQPVDDEEYAGVQQQQPHDDGGDPHLGELLGDLHAGHPQPPDKSRTPTPNADSTVDAAAAGALGDWNPFAAGGDPTSTADVLPVGDSTPTHYDVATNPFLVPESMSSGLGEASDEQWNPFV